MSATRSEHPGYAYGNEKKVQKTKQRDDGMEKVKHTKEQSPRLYFWRIFKAAKLQKELPWQPNLDKISQNCTDFSSVQNMEKICMCVIGL